MNTLSTNTDTDNLDIMAMIEAPFNAPLSYIRPAKGSEGEGYTVCSETGDVLASFNTYEAAYYTARQFRLEPLSVH